MSRPDPETLLAFLEGRLGEAERVGLLAQLEGDAALAGELRAAASGLEAMTALAEEGDAAAGNASRRTAALERAAAGRMGAGADRRAPARGISPWWVAAAAIGAIAVSVPLTLRVPARDRPPADVAGLALGRPADPDPAFVLILHGTWPDAAALDQAETRRRAAEYWGWTSDLARRGLLVAAGDLRWEPGRRLGPAGATLAVDDAEVRSGSFPVGMFALRVSTYEEALRIARDCPHLRYGGSVSVRRVGTGFVTTPGVGDWAS